MCPLIERWPRSPKATSPLHEGARKNCSTEPCEGLSHGGPRTSTLHNAAAADEPAHAAPKTDRAPCCGPQRAHNTGRHEPQSLADHVDMARDRVKGLGPKQRLALHNGVVKMTRDIGFIKLVANSIHGPYSAAAVPDEEIRSSPSVRRGGFFFRCCVGCVAFGGCGGCGQ